MTVLPPVQSAGTLRERFVADMTVRGFSANTQHDYLRTVAGFASFPDRSPSTATAEDIRRFQIEHERPRNRSPPAVEGRLPAAAA